jgi:hypothetical protein
MTRAHVRIDRDTETPDSSITEVVEGPASDVTQSETIAQAQSMQQTWTRLTKGRAKRSQ